MKKKRISKKMRRILMTRSLEAFEPVDKEKMEKELNGALKKLDEKKC